MHYSVQGFRFFQFKFRKPAVEYEISSWKYVRFSGHYAIRWWYA